MTKEPTEKEKFSKFKDLRGKFLRAIALMQLYACGIRNVKKNEGLNDLEERQAANIILKMLKYILSLNTLFHSLMLHTTILVKSHQSIPFYSRTIIQGWVLLIQKTNTFHLEYFEHETTKNSILSIINN